MKGLIEKYNVPVPRYTSYPTVPHWQSETINVSTWEGSVKQASNQFHEDGISIYIHLPFCESMCTFCGCHKHITRRHEMESPYIDAVLKEWQLYLKLFDKKTAAKGLTFGWRHANFLLT